ncbi:MAG: DUF4013 domain-containing protein [Candidatus Diapherotrites archaeon]|nr:DUF4013 domain-containing protein [Candidatus Diapherotrites archaeon]
MVDYLGCIRKPFSGLKNTLLAFVIGLVGTLTFGLVNILLSGFVFESVKNHLHNDRHMPHFEAGNAVQYFLDGLKVLVVMVVYSIPGGILLVLAFGGIILGFLAGGDTITVSGAILSSGMLGLFGFILWSIGQWFAWLGVVNMAERDHLGAAFNLPVILRTMLSGKFLVSLIVSIAYLFILLFVFAFLGVISLGLLLVALSGGLFVYAYQATVLTIMAETFAETQ